MVNRLSDKLNKSGEDDPHLYNYPHRLRTDTASSGSDDQVLPPRSATFRSMTFTALNNLDEEASFANSSMAQLPSSHKEEQEESTDYAQHPLAQSDTSPQLTMPPRRPSLKPGFGMYLNETHSKPHQHQPNTLYHAPSNTSLFSEAPSSIYSNNSLNNSMDTMALSSSSNNGSSIYGSSFASTASGFSSLNGKKRMLHSFNNYDDDDEASEEVGSDHNVSWTLNGPFGAPSVPTTVVNSTGAFETPSIVTDGHGAIDYFTAFGTSILDSSAATPKDTTSVSITSNKRPYPGTLNTNAAKPPLHKSYTFDAISTSPTKKYMRLDEGWSSFQPGQSYANGIGYSGSIGGSNSVGGMMLESPFEMEFGSPNLKQK
jgi:hypothetical protein